MKKLKLKDILIPTISLFIICLVVSALLAGTNALTKEPIELNAQKKAADAMESVCAYAESFEPYEVNDSSVTCHKARGKDNNLLGYAISTSAKGYGGDVQIMVGISMEGEVTGVEILSHSETPGLGANCVNDSFRNEFLQDIPEGEFYVVKDSSGGSEAKIDALTGATITSNAVSNGVNKAIEVFKSIQIKGGEQ